MRMRLLSALVLVFLVLAVRPARAGYAYTFDSSSYTVGVGQTVDVMVYLSQTGSTTGLSNPGLQSGGVQLNYNTTYVGNTQIAPNNTTFTGSAPTGFDPDYNTAVIGNGSNGLAAGASVVGVSQLFPESPVKAGSGAPNTANSILLGTFQFTGVSTGSSLIVTSNSFPGEDVNVLGDGTVIDSMIQNSSAVITVVAVPEPGTLFLTGMAAAALGLSAWRRRRRAIAGRV
jgi:hypothetical protein